MNEWQPIETLPLDLPADWIGVYVWRKGNRTRFVDRMDHDSVFVAILKIFTHWQPVLPPEPPKG